MGIVEAVDVLTGKLAYLTDEGPEHSGWKSDELQAAIEVTEKFLALLKLRPCLASLIDTGISRDV